MSIRNLHWKIRNTNTKKTLFERLIENRNLETREDLDYFFHEQPLLALHDPLLLKNMDRALDRIEKALKNKERIIIFGDYDVDGITGTTILFQTLNKLNANISYRLPDRQSDGYGLNKKFIQEFIGKKVKLLITVDCGISCKEEVAFARSNDIDTIITDHHAIPKPEHFPHEACAIIHPKQEGCPYPWKEITGAGVAFKLAHALHKKYDELPDNGFEYLMDLAGLGTVADCAPLTGENRHIVRHGLRILKNTQNFGLKHLKKMAGLDKIKEYNTETMSFQLGPRINAAGRIAHPYFALQLLLSEEGKAKRFAEKLERLNKERRRLTGLAMEEAEQKFGKNPEKHNILIAHDPNWPSGIIGLIAGKMEEKYTRPCIIMEDRGEKLIGSMRSPEFFSTIDLLTGASEYLDRFGGHEQAGGFDLKKENLDPFMKCVNEIANETLKNKKIENIFPIECELYPEEINFDSLKTIKKFEPFGIGNEKPNFLIRGTKVKNIRTIGRDGKHMNFDAHIKDNRIRCIAFNFGHTAAKIREGSTLDLVCHLEENEWNGNTALQLKIIDFAEQKTQ